MALFAFSAAIGCAQERDPINRVEALALDKSFFVGANLADGADDPEFYATTTVVDVPYGLQASVFTGSTGELRRVKWEITEDQLNARLTYEIVNGVDGHGARTTNTGQVVASFKIQSHFDIKRDYNPQTGEELNIIGENTTDRPWYQRQFMRVDWSQNLVEAAYSFDPLAMLKLDGQEIKPVAFPSQPGDPNAPVFDATAGYFDVTNKVSVSPGTINGLPSCYYYAAIVVGGTFPYGTCDPSEVTLRLSFQRLAQPGEAGYRDYEPRDWDGARFNAHGAFVRDRLGYDRHYGVIDSNWHHLIQRYNLWQKSHLDLPCALSATSDPHADANGDGTEDECAVQGAPAGSRCDDLVGQCTIPYALRATRPNAWHYNLNGNDDVIFDATNRAAEEWDTALRIAVQSARRVECDRTGGASIAGTRWEGMGCAQAFPVQQGDDLEVQTVRQVDACWKVSGRNAAACAPPDPNSVAAMSPMIALCHSPVAAVDDPMCGPAGLVTRPGDLRYHQVNVVPTPQSASPWGYGPTNADPLTGEVIQASINVWNTVTDQSAQFMVDQVRWINGEIPTSQVTSGNYVQDWARAAAGHAPGASPLMTPEAIDGLIMGTGATTKESLARAPQLRQSLNMRQMNQQILAQTMPAISQPGIAAPANGSSAVADVNARIAAVKGTPTELALVTPMWQQMACTSSAAMNTLAWCKNPGTAVDDTSLDMVSPLRNLDPTTVTQMSNTVTTAMAQQGQCMMLAPEPTGIVPLAKIMAKKFPYNANASAADQSNRVNTMWNYLRAKLNYAVIAHEMGHTVGLRHNFASSFDKFNYRPQYWQLRTRGNTVNNPCPGPTNDGSTCVGPRYFDPLDQDEIDQMIWMWSQTTVMDYAGDMTQDTLGLGVYDYSAMRAFYADVVDVRDDGVIVPSQNRSNSNQGNDAVGSEMFQLVDSVVQPLAHAFVQDAAGNSLHYSQWNSFFHLINNCRHVDTPTPDNWDVTANGIYDPVFDGHIVRSEVCDRLPVAYTDWRDMLPDNTQAVLVNYDPRFAITRRAVDKLGRPRMPYAFSSDELVEAGIPSTYQHDNGADIYEEMVFHDDLYEDRHIFDNFRRGRVSFSIYGAYQRAMQRYHGKIASLSEEYSFIHDAIFRNIAFDPRNNVGYDQVVAIYEGQGGPLRDFAIASSLAFDHFTRVLSRPQVGPHNFNSLDDLLRPMDGAAFGTSAPLDVPQGTMGVGNDISFGGRPLENSVVSSDGYWNVNQAGDYYEKTAAMLEIVAQGMGSGNWARVDAIDSRWLTSNFSNLFPDGVRRLLGSVLTEDQALYAPRVSLGVSGIPESIRDPLTNTHYPARALGWVSFVPPAGPAVCWPKNGTEVCTDAVGQPLPGMLADAPTSSQSIDPEVGFEIQKFILLYSYIFLPASQRNDWLDMLRLFKLGSDANPSFDPSETVVWKDPQSGFRYLAKRFGDEQILGKTYDKGIGAKMLQWANHLASLSYQPADPANPNEVGTGRFLYAVDANGQPVVKADPTYSCNPITSVCVGVAPADPANVKCEENRYCVQLRNYRALLDYSHDTMIRVGFPDPFFNGIY